MMMVHRICGQKAENLSEGLAEPPHAHPHYLRSAHLQRSPPTHTRIYIRTPHHS